MQLIKHEVNHSIYKTPNAPQAAKPKFVAKGHDAILKTAQDSKQSIRVVMTSGEVADGTVYNRDKFTITIEGADNTKTTYYKHAIESFSIGGK